MTKKLLLVDLENRQRIDLSLLDESYSAIVFVGVLQNPPKAASKSSTKHKFQRVEFIRIDAIGKNALDFHIAFQLGRVFETSPATECVILSGDAGYDPLVRHLIRLGRKCRRVDNMNELVQMPTSPSGVDQVVCATCKLSRTIELHGGRWCANCGRFAVAPDPKLLPSNQPGYRPRAEETLSRPHPPAQARLVCGSCGDRSDMLGGIYDDGEWMCGQCVASHCEH